MNLLFFIITFLYSLVNLYAYLKRNESIKDGGRYWIHSFGFLFTGGIIHVFNFLMQPWYIFTIPLMAYGYFAYKISRIMISGLHGQWQEMRNDEEIKEQILEHKRQTVDYVQTALEELPSTNFSEEFKKDIINHLTDH